METKTYIDIQDLECYSSSIYNKASCAVHLLSLVDEMLDWPRCHNGEQHSSCLGPNPVFSPMSLLKSAKYLLWGIEQDAENLLEIAETEGGIQ